MTQSEHRELGSDALEDADHDVGDTAWTQDVCMFAGLTLRVYAMPHRVDHYVQEHEPALSIGLLLDGAMHLGVRQTPRRWVDHYVQYGDLFLRPPNADPRELRWQTTAGEATHMLNLYLHHDLLLQVIKDVTECDPANVEFIEQTGFHDPLLLELGRSLYHESQHPSPTASLYAEAATHMLAVHLLHRYTTTAMPIHKRTGGLTNRQLQRVYEFVHEHLAHNLSLALLAEQVNLRPSYFSRLFHQASGETPHQFVLRQRLERARALLETTDTPLVEIARASGFANQSYLTTVFKQRLGLTPQAYRRRVR